LGKIYPGVLHHDEDRLYSFTDSVQALSKTADSKGWQHQQHIFKTQALQAIAAHTPHLCLLGFHIKARQLYLKTRFTKTLMLSSGNFVTTADLKG